MIEKHFKRGSDSSSSKSETSENEAKEIPKNN
jgi:hypothetical protein